MTRRKGNPFASSLSRPLAGASIPSKPHRSNVAAQAHADAPASRVRRRRRKNKGDRRNGSSTCLGHLDLGDVGASGEMLDCDPLLARELVFGLRRHDFAFVLRSDGRWTYAIIAERQEKKLRFVVDKNGSTKSVYRKDWLDSIRLVNNSYNRERLPPALPWNDHNNSQSVPAGMGAEKTKEEQESVSVLSLFL